MLEFSIITITSFVSILDSCTILIEKNLCKQNDPTKKDFKRFIPIFSLVYGVILGLLGYFMPDVDMGKNVVEAIFVGLSAGAAATGVNQVGKQLGKDDTMSSIVMYLKKFIDDANVSDEDIPEIQPDESIETEEPVIDEQNEEEPITEEVSNDVTPDDYNENE